MGSELSASRVVSMLDLPDFFANFFEDEHPRHTVTMKSGFWLGTKEVTHREFERFVKATGHETDAERYGWGYGRNEYGESLTLEKINGLNWRKPGWQPDGNEPVVLVSWNDANAYIRWLNGQGNGSYRLPTEAEWEYACRAGTRTLFFWGDRPADGKAYLNGADATESPQGGVFGDRFPYSDGFFFPAPAGSFRANPWGLHDMLGNVAEWCADSYGAYTSSAATDPHGSGSGERRVHRGGSWNSFPAYCRAADREYDTANARYVLVGFRLLRAQD
jgi:formylglycine-generating enzyme required for sulfatase activity